MQKKIHSILKKHGKLIVVIQIKPNTTDGFSILFNNYMYQLQQYLSN